MNSSFLLFLFLILIYAAGISSILAILLGRSGRSLPNVARNIMGAALAVLALDLAIALFFGFPYTSFNFSTSGGANLMVGLMYLFTLLEMIGFLVFLLYYRYLSGKNGNR